MALVRVEVSIRESDRDALDMLLCESCPQGWEEFEPGIGLVDEFETEPDKACGKSALAPGELKFVVHFTDQAPVREFLGRLCLRAPNAATSWSYVKEEDWSQAWKQFFTPVDISGVFVVLPPWLAENFELKGRVPIFIEPKMAFGTGHHPTTALCLEVIADLLGRGRIKAGESFLDLGTGSGILGIACAMKGLAGLGLDIDSQSILNAQENKSLNAVHDEFDLACGSIDHEKAGREFDLVVANILAEPLIELAPMIVSGKKAGGCLVLSGILAIQTEKVIKAYMECGLPEPVKTIRGEWAGLVWE